MKTYRVTRNFVGYGYLDVKAENAEQAEELVKDVCGGDFITLDDYIFGHSDITSVEEIDDDAEDLNLYEE